MELMDRTTKAYGEATEFYRRSLETVAKAQERNLRFSKEWFERANAEYGRQFAANVAMSEELVDRVLEQRKVYRTFVDSSVGAYLDLVYAPFGQFRKGLELVEETGNEVVDATLSGVETVAEVASEAVFPVDGYDALNVEQVKAEVEGLGAAGIRTLRDYEKENKNRETLIDFFDRKLRAQSA